MANVLVCARTALLPAGAPVEGVYVALYTTNGTKLTADFTGADGIVALGERAAGTYEVFLTTGAGQVSESGNRLSITVDAEATNLFDVIINTSGLPTSTNSSFCRCSGYLVDMFGRPLSGAVLVFSALELPTMLYNDGVPTVIASSPKTLHTDAQGYLAVDLVRGGKYTVVMTGFDNVSWAFDVPDQLSSSLPFVLFPLVEFVEYTVDGNVLVPRDAPTLSITLGEEKSVSVRTYFYSGIVKDEGSAVVFTPTPTEIVDLQLTQTGFNLQGTSAGTVVVEVARRETEEEQTRIFGAPALYPALTVTVS